MADITTLATALGGIKTAYEIAKALRESDNAYERAEFRLKLAEIMNSLADAKAEVIEAQELLRGKEQELADLHEAFESKDQLVKSADAYYSVDSQGKPTGEPFCASCWQTRRKRFSLQREATDNFVKVCLCCKTRFEARRTPDIRPA